MGQPTISVGHIADHLADNGELLGILLPEKRLIGKNNIKQLGDDGAYAAEVDRAGLAAELLGHVVQNFHECSCISGIHFSHGGVEDHAGSVLFQKPAVVVKIPGVSLKILPGAELCRIDEIRDHYSVAYGNGAVHQAGVAFMQKSHGRDQTDRQSFFFPCSHLLPHFADCFCNYHFVSSFLLNAHHSVFWELFEKHL